MKKINTFGSIAMGGVLFLGVFAGVPTSAQEAPQVLEYRGDNIYYGGASRAVKGDISPPLRDIPTVLRGSTRVCEDDRPSKLMGPCGPAEPFDPVAQTCVGGGAGQTEAMPATGVSFNGFANLCGCSPPDPVGDVGPNHYVAMANSTLAVYSKTGTLLWGPSDINSVWSGFGGACQTENAGDPVVLYDQFADRWLISQFTANGPTFYNCVALSTTADPTGTWLRYAFSNGTNFPDYPKYGIWADGYYFSTRNSDGTQGAYALNRTQMLAGDLSPQVVDFILAPGSTPYYGGDGLLPADIDGGAMPPAGSPEIFLGSMDDGGPYGAPSDALNIFKFHVDWATPANSTFARSSSVAVAAFSSTFAPCSPGARDCISQPGTTQKVDIQSYRQRVIHRAAYRNFGTHESIVTNQSVAGTATIAGIRWYELRDPNGSPFLFQQGTYAPGSTDGTHRWMASAAQDMDGDMALGFSASSDSVYPSVWYTGRLVDDPLGTMPQGEGSIIDGLGSQTGSSRWGDYTSLNIDPTDDCTFWYINQYYPATSAQNWRLRIGSFKFPSCGSGRGTITLNRDLYRCNSTVTISVADQSVPPMNSGSVTVTIWSTTETTPETVTLTESATEPGNFAGTFPTYSGPAVHGDGKLSVANGGTVTVRYIDADDGRGGTHIAREDTASLDCQPPVISDVRAGSITGTTANILWTTNEPADSHVQYRPPPLSIDDPTTLTENHLIALTGLTPCATYSFDVASVDPAGNSTNAMNFGFTTTPELEPVLTRTPAQVIPDNDPAGVWSALSVADGRTIQDLDVTVNVQHPRPADLELRLRSPDGTTIALVQGAGGPQANFTGTVFDDEANTSISSGTPPFTGRYRPAGALSAFDGKNATGNWRLTAIDSVVSETGIVLDWSLRLTYAPYSCGAQLELASHAFTEECTGTDPWAANGFADPGERITVQAVLLNSGSVETRNVSGTLYTTSPWATITRNAASFPDILPGAQGFSDPEHFAFRIDPGTPCGEVLTFSLHLMSYEDPVGWYDYFSITTGDLVLGATAVDFDEDCEGFGDQWPTGSGWAEHNNSSFSWDLYDRLGCEDPFSLYQICGSTNPADAWMFTPGLSLAPGVSYTLEFSQRASDGFSDEDATVDLSVWAGTGQTEGAMTIPVWAEDNLANRGCEVCTAVFTVPAAGTYNIGFHATTPAGGGQVDLDDFKVTHQLVGSCDVSICTPCVNPGAPVISAITDPYPCEAGSVRVWFTEGSGAQRHDLYMDGTLVIQGLLSSPAVITPGDTDPHEFTVRAISGGCTTVSAPVTGADEANPVPGIPSPSAEDIEECDPSGIGITWSPVPGATSYDLRVDGSTTLSGVSSPHTYTPPDASPHTFAVRAQNGDCASVWSSTVSASDQDLMPGTPPAPTVADLDVCALTGVRVTWPPVADATAYDVIVDGTTILYGVTSPHTYLPGNSSSHSFQVRALRASCKGDWSASTAGSDAINVATPAPPTVTDADPCAQSGVVVTWSPVPDATGYDLVLDGSELFPDVTSPYPFDPRDTAVHGYAIRAKASGCTGDRSDATDKADLDKSVTVPTGMRASDLDACIATGVRLTWDPVAGATGYDLYVDDRDIVPGVTSPATHLPGDTDPHTYRVRAKTDSCTSGWSSADSARDEATGPATPEAPRVQDMDGCARSGIEVAWDPIPGATYHDLRVDGTTLYSDAGTYKEITPGDGADHTFELRGRTASCTGLWSPASVQADFDHTPTAALITSVEDLDPLQPTGVRVNFTPGGGATRHDLLKDAAVVVTGYTSGTAYVPGDALPHTFVVRAYNLGCTVLSNGVQGTDAPLMPPAEVAPGTSAATAQSWPDTTTHTWPVTATCTSGYLLYRGTQADLPLLLDGSEDSCLRFRSYAPGDTTKTGMTEDPSVEPGRFYWYLVTGLNGVGEGTAGSGTAGPRAVDVGTDCLTP